MSRFRNVVILFVIILSVYQSRNSSIIFLDDMFIALLLHVCCDDNAVQQNKENYPGCTKMYKQSFRKQKKGKKRVSFTSQFVILQISLHIYFFNYRSFLLLFSYSVPRKEIHCLCRGNYLVKESPDKEVISIH